MVGLISTIIFLLLMILAINERARFPILNTAFNEVVGGINNSSSIVSNSINNTNDFISAAFFTKAENEKLKKEVSSLRNANIRAADIWAENKRLRKLVNYKERNDNLNLLTAKVIGMNLSDFNDRIIINCGSKSGIEKNMTVINADGLIGIVETVNSNTSMVLTITSPKAKVGAIDLRAESRVFGVATGIAGVGSDILMKNMAEDADVKENDIIMTSGLGDNHPEGIVIGFVEKTKEDAGGLLKSAILRPAVDFSRLEEVMIVRGFVARKTDGLKNTNRNIETGGTKR